FTGELAEDVVENLAGINETDIENHEHSAERLLWAIGVVGVLALFQLILELKEVKKLKWGYTPLIIAIAISGYFAKDTGTTGGEIRHPEIRQESNVTNPNSELKKSDQKAIKTDDD